MNIIPFVSTHFKISENYPRTVTKGKIYKIESWLDDDGDIYFDFLDNSSKKRRWIWYKSQTSVTDCSYEMNLNEILK